MHSSTSYFRQEPLQQIGHALGPSIGPVFSLSKICYQCASSKHAIRDAGSFRSCRRRRWQDTSLYFWNVSSTASCCVCKMIGSEDEWGGRISIAGSGGPSSAPQTTFAFAAKSF